MFGGCIMLVLAIGYGHAIGYVYLTTHMIPKGIEERYRGTESAGGKAGDSLAASAVVPALPSSEELEDTSKVASLPTATTSGLGEPAELHTAPTVTGEMQYEKSLAELLNLVHTHVLSMTFIFALSGFLTLMTQTLPGRVRSFAVIEPFVGILLTFGGIWATRYLGRGFSWLVSVSGALMAFAFTLQCWAVLSELLASRKQNLFQRNS
jgi:hypothetical protein